MPDPIKVIKYLFVLVTTHPRLKVTLSRSQILRGLAVDKAYVVQSGVLPVPLVVLHSLERYFEVSQSSELHYSVIPDGTVVSVNAP